MTTRRFIDAAGLLVADAELNGRVAVLLLSALSNHLDAVNLKHGDRHVIAFRGE
jgi:hypothetical protein